MTAMNDEIFCLRLTKSKEAYDLDMEEGIHLNMRSMVLVSGDYALVELVKSDNEAYAIGRLSAMKPNHSLDLPITDCKIRFVGPDDAQVHILGSYIDEAAYATNGFDDDECCSDEDCHCARQEDSSSSSDEE